MTAPRSSEARAGAGLRLLRAAVFTAACVVLSAAGHGLASGVTVPLWTLAAGFGALLLVVLPLAGQQRSLLGIAGVLAAGQITLHILFGIGQHDMAMAHGAGTAPGHGAGTAPGHGAHAASGDGAHATSAHGAAMPAHMAGMPNMPSMAGSHLPTSAGAHLPAAAGAHHSGMPPALHGTALHGTAPHAADVLTHTGGGLPGLGDGSSPTAYTVPLLHVMLMLPSLPMLLGHVLAAIAAGWLLRRGDLAVFRLVALSAQGVTEAALVRALRAALRLVRALRAGLPGATRSGTRPPRPTEPAPSPPEAAVLQHSVIRRGPPTTRALLLTA